MRKNTSAVSLLLSLLLLFIAVPTLAAEYTGKVVGVSDGDTLTLLTPERQQIRVRLGEIDTPESKQPYGTRAKQALSDLAFGKEARVVEQDRDKYGRVVGRVYVGNVDVNAELVRQGAAWVYRQYAQDQALYALESDAKAAKRGLWALPEASQLPPWEWRKLERQSSGSGAQPPASTAAAPVAPTSASSAGYTCAGKRYCREMTSCAEARFYLERCGVRTLDGDGDGVPCEKLCQ